MNEVVFIETVFLGILEWLKRKTRRLRWRSQVKRKTQKADPERKAVAKVEAKVAQKARVVTVKVVKAVVVDRAAVTRSLGPTAVVPLTLSKGDKRWFRSKGLNMQLMLTNRQVAHRVCTVVIKAVFLPLTVSLSDSFLSYVWIRYFRRQSCREI